MSNIFLIIFFIATVAHLYASLKQDKPLRDRTKPFIILSLLGFYLFSVDKPALTVVLALVFSWLGDMFLIPKGTKWFTAGGIAFVVSHLFLILTFTRQIDWTLINSLFLIVLPLIYVAATVVVFRRLRTSLPKGLFYPMFLYLLLNGVMNCFAWFRSFSIPGYADTVAVIGALLFYISDVLMFFVRFDRNSMLKTHFLVMLTYSIGKLLIILGLIAA